MKKALIIAALVGVIYVAAKTTTNTIALQQLSAKIKALKGISFSQGNINIKLDLNITNLSKFSLQLDTYNLLTIKSLKFYNIKNSLLIGEAKVNISNVYVPAEETIVLADIIAEIPTDNVLSHLSLFNGNAGNNIGIVVGGTVAGKDFEINPENFV